VNVAEFEKFPATVRSDGAVTLPVVIVKSVVDALSPNVHPPEEPLKVTAPKVVNGEVVAMIIFPDVVALKVIVCAPGLNIEVELAFNEPAKVSVLVPKVIIDEVPFAVGKCKLPSKPLPDGPFPAIVTSPPGANSELVAM